MEWILLLWPTSGWACAYFSTPRWMIDDFEAYFMLFLCGAVAGPLGILWFLDKDYRR